MLIPCLNDDKDENALKLSRALVFPVLPTPGNQSTATSQCLDVKKLRPRPPANHHRIPPMGHKAETGVRIHFKERVKDGALSWCHLICDGIKQALFCLLDTDQRSGDGQGIGNRTRENPEAVVVGGNGFSSRPTSVSMLPSSSSWER